MDNRPPGLLQRSVAPGGGGRQGKDRETEFMRTTVVLALMVAAGYCRADDARDWVEQAVRAHTGTDARLAKLQNYVQTARGTVTFVGTGSREGQLSLPDRVRWSFEFSQPGRKLAIILGVNGTRAGPPRRGRSRTCR